MFGPTTQSATVLLGRVLLAAIFILSGYGKINGYAGTVGYMEKVGVPGILLPLVILTELGGGLLILTGFLTRYAAIALAGFTLIAGIILHFQPTDQGQMINFMKNLAIAGGFLALFVSGPGMFSVDGMMGRKAL